MGPRSLLYINLLIALFFFLPSVDAKEKTFTVVIDAGHGGKDPGARGTVINEKEINLSVALKLGRLIEDKNEDVRVIYTRKTDRFIELDERANIANRNKADLFISIHTNSVKRGSAAKGTETYTLGLARSDENLAVAMRENSAILLEDNYLQKYEGFDPNSSESYIIFEFMQNKHMEQSISLASEIQKSFVLVKRANRGVRQAGFLVLRKTSMPSVLIELGYISNQEEERFLKSADGQSKLAQAIYMAFNQYKRDFDRKRGALSGKNLPTTDVSSANQLNKKSDGKKLSQNPPPGSEEDIRRKHNEVAQSKQTTSRQLKLPQQTVQSTSSNRVNTDTKGKVIYKIQILTSDKKLPANSKLFKGYKNVNFYKEKGLYKYTYGETTDFDSIRKMRRVVAKDFKDAFIVAFKDGVKVKY
ncbi:N-acetylmuramoyl-L-alanine amidase family protein [Parabacteroides bouchesdurhonensis]|uniref:N-acetylmuramoyl-L-alanine amidase family protein n=1 Tax=Parabacteroides bouchesdurhonensis TaxID=1936995 RepID=UPI000C838B65|nr:N-acetylmuramoyl-L-alanine amidase [Parabacteroides bouchesdurhonensis]